MAPDVGSKTACEHSDTPQWLTLQYMQQSLRQYFKDEQLIVRDLNVRKALEKGENYGSVMYRLQVTYSNGNDQRIKQSSYVLKTIPAKDAYVASLLQSFASYKRELEVYEIVVPKLKAILKEVGQTGKLFPDCLRVDYEHYGLLLEDLAASGWKMADRRKGLDMAHVKVLLANLAKMHVASVMFNEKENGCLLGYDRGFFNRYSEGFKTFFVENIKACVRSLQPVQDMSAYAEKLMRLTEVYMQLGLRIFDVVPQQLNVFNHGDLWTNNMLFEYDGDGAPVNAIFLDFQCAVWASPAVDLHYLFNTSLTAGVRQNQQDELFDYYYQMYASCFKNFQIVEGLKMHSQYKFYMEMQGKLFYALHACCAVQPVMLNEYTADADLNALMGVDERAIKYKDNLYKNDKVQANLRNLLPKFERMGLLEIDQ